MFRLVALYLAAILLLGIWANVASGEETPTAPKSAAPTAALDDRLTGFAEMVITTTDDAISAPAEVPAGPTLVTQINQAGEDARLTLVRVPDEVSDDQVGATRGSSVIPDWLADAQRVGGPDQASTRLCLPRTLTPSCGDPSRLSDSDDGAGRSTP